MRLAGQTIATFEASALAGPAAQLVVTPRISVLGVGQTQQLAAELQDRFGNGVPVDALSWSSGDADVAQVSQLGLITGIAPGSIDVSVVASAAAPVGSSQTPATVSGSAQVTITGGGATDFVVDTGDGQTGHAGSPFPAPLVAKVVDSDGFGVADIAVAWAVTAGGGSVDQLLTSTDGNGLSTVTWTSGPGVGTQTLTATAEGLGSVVFTGDVLPGLAAVVTVEAENTALVWGQYTTLSVSAIDPFGGPVSVTDVEWGTSDASVLSVAGGLVRGIAAGVAQATATVDGQTGSATISVTPVHVGSPVARDSPGLGDDECGREPHVLRRWNRHRGRHALEPTRPVSGGRGHDRPVRRLHSRHGVRHIPDRGRRGLFGPSGHRLGDGRWQLVPTSSLVWHLVHPGHASERGTRARCVSAVRRRRRDGGRIVSADRGHLLGHRRVRLPNRVVHSGLIAWAIHRRGDRSDWTFGVYDGLDHGLGRLIAHATIQRHVVARGDVPRSDDRHPCELASGNGHHRLRLPLRGWGQPLAAAISADVDIGANPQRSAALDLGVRRDRVSMVDERVVPQRRDLPHDSRPAMAPGKRGARVAVGGAEERRPSSVSASRRPP